MKIFFRFILLILFVASPLLFIKGEADSIDKPPALMGGTNLKEALSHAHWNRPVVTKGGIEPDPAKCGACHSGQLADWSGSLHSKSMSVGLTSQLSPYTNPGFAGQCYQCHAPAAEQHEMLPGENGFQVNKDYDAGFRDSGVSCAACHLRGETVRGPDEPKLKEGEGAHPSAKLDLFKSAEFCAACHQLPKDGGVTINGKPLMNTYNEWKESYYGEHNITCQNCHMPGGKHLFRGIHDPETVRSGLKFKVVDVSNESSVKASLTISNVKVGHYFPTYVTPIVIVRGTLLGADGKPIKGTGKESIIARYVTDNLSEEVFDTRIAPLESFEFMYDKPRSVGAAKLLIEVWVLPDEFYNRMFTNILKQLPDNKPFQDAQKITSESPYLLYKKVIKL